MTRPADRQSEVGSGFGGCSGASRRGTTLTTRRLIGVLSLELPGRGLVVGRLGRRPRSRMLDATGCSCGEWSRRGRRLSRRRRAVAALATVRRRLTTAAGSCRGTYGYADEPPVASRRAARSGSAERREAGVCGGRRAAERATGPGASHARGPPRACRLVLAPSANAATSAAQPPAPSRSHCGCRSRGPAARPLRICARSDGVRRLAALLSGTSGRARRSIE